MKTTLGLTLLMLSFNVSARYENVSIIGRPIKSTLEDQVCHLLINKKKETCTAIRLSTNYVLTAEHCVRSREGELKEIKVKCGGKSIEIEKIFESQEYAKNFQSEEFEKNPDRKSYIDFAVLKLKNASPFNAQAKLLKNLEEYKAVFLSSAADSVHNFSEDTICEMHGHGIDASNRVNNYNIAGVNSTTTYRDTQYFMTVTQKRDNIAFVATPRLPENDKRASWISSTVRPGDSGGPLFCKTKNNEWVISGVASLLRSRECPENMQYAERKFFERKLECSSNEWGLPTKEALESVVGVLLPE